MDYPIPAEGASDLDDCRLHHADLPAMSDDELLREWCRVMVAIAKCSLSDDGSRWLLQRWRALTAEKDVRKHREDRDARRLATDRAPRGTQVSCHPRTAT
jgi:hypothetical protein